MTIRELVREWLGYNEILAHCHNIEFTIDNLARTLGNNNEIRIHNHALGRLIAKLDPIYLKDELSPERRSESDRIAADVLAKLSAELIAARRNGGEL